MYEIFLVKNICVVTPYFSSFFCEYGFEDGTGGKPVSMFLNMT